MDVGTLYRSKLTTPDQAVVAIPSGSKLSMGMAMAEPPALLKALADRAGAGGIEDLKVDWIFRRGFEGEIEHSLATAGKTIGRPGLEQHDRGVGVSFCHLLQRRDVIENVESASICGDDEIVEVLLHYGPRNWRMW